MSAKIVAVALLIGVALSACGEQTQRQSIGYGPAPPQNPETAAWECIFEFEVFRKRLCCVAFFQPPGSFDRPIAQTLVGKARGEYRLPEDWNELVRDLTNFSRVCTGPTAATAKRTKDVSDRLVHRMVFELLRKRVHCLRIVRSFGREGRMRLLKEAQKNIGKILTKEMEAEFEEDEPESSEPGRSVPKAPPKPATVHLASSATGTSWTMNGGEPRHMATTTEILKASIRKLAEDKARYHVELRVALEPRLTYYDVAEFLRVCTTACGKRGLSVTFGWPFKRGK